MNRATPKMRNLARLLIAFDRKINKSSGSESTDDFHICEKLRPQLSTLVGEEAFRALLAHALALASAEFPGLGSMQVKADGTLEASEEIHTQIQADKYFEGRIIVVAQLLGLLVDFIGEELTQRLVRECWPKIALDDLDPE